MGVLSDTMPDGFIHDCHADGCDSNSHQEIPFCKRHFNMLPEAHRKALWNERRQDGLCTACYPRLDAEPGLEQSERWQELFNLGVAILLVIEYEECGAPSSMYDSEGFCWGCGVADAEKTYVTANKIVKKFGLKATA